ncbi:MAG: twin-arginine translocase subunit TatC [Prevotellaceae bacterium]|jgi:sec-independent protein translocase protein TatC|nr:twin-arginine translocase subunit TatC [Prevotellaceae bacterium]
MGENEGKEFTFWDHLDELRKILFRVLIVVVSAMVGVFLNKEILFNVVLAPHRADFVTYRLLCQLAEWLAVPSVCPEAFTAELINTQLPSQFMVHMSVAFYVGVLLVFPYVLYQVYRFVSPALYASERRYSMRIIVFSSLLFFAGVLLNYFLIFPFSFRFLATYQVSAEIENLINLSSYIDTLMLLSLMLGIMSEMPVISWLFAKLGFLSAPFMKKHRKHAVILILILLAVITPTTDIITLMLVFAPIYALFELSIWIVKRSEKLENGKLRIEN